MKPLSHTCVLFLVLSSVFVFSCGKPQAERPFEYSFIKPLHLRRERGKPYADYKAIYLLTEDFEPEVESPFDVESIRDALKFGSSLSSTYKVPWTHFVDPNALSGAFVSDDQQLRAACQSMIEDLKNLGAGGDDFELHLHGPLNSKLRRRLRSQHKLHLARSFNEAEQPYRQRRSFFFRTFYDRGYQDLVSSLAYGKSFLESVLYGGSKSVLAFRPGGWDHGSSIEDTQLYFHALAEAGLKANSGLSTGNFGDKNWRVGNDPGHNLATVAVGEHTLIEVSPTAGPGGYLNPVLATDLRKLASAARNEIPVIVAVYHTSGLQRTKRAIEDGTQQPDLQIQTERDALENHMRTVSELAAAKILYPTTLRELLAIISDWNRND